MSKTCVPSSLAIGVMENTFEVRIIIFVVSEGG